MPTVPGPATLLIDVCYVAKRSLCVTTDDALGLEKSSIYSFTGFLEVCYGLRRPFFVIADAVCIIDYRPTR